MMSAPPVNACGHFFKEWGYAHTIGSATYSLCCITWTDGRDRGTAVKWSKWVHQGELAAERRRGSYRLKVFASNHSHVYPIGSVGIYGTGNGTRNPVHLPTPNPYPTCVLTNPNFRCCIFQVVPSGSIPFSIVLLYNRWVNIHTYIHTYI